MAYKYDPRGLKQEQAAQIAGVCVATFAKYVKEGRYPGPTLPGKRWDRKALEAAMDKYSKLEESSTPYREWKNARRA